MSLSWIRVNASLLDDPDVRAFGVGLMPKSEPWAARLCAAGLLVALWGKMAAQQPDGQASARDDEQLEEWAQWKGKPGAFAAAFRARFVDDRGTIRLWDEYQGAALARREADRIRKSRERTKEAPRGGPVKITPPVTPPVLRTSRRNGTLTVTDTNSGTAGERGQVDKSVEKFTKRLQPPAAVAEMKPQRLPAPPLPSAEPSNVVTRFMARFYAGAGKERRADVARQMTGAFTGAGIQFEGGLVRAVDSDHLDDVCLEVMEEPPRDSNAAWVFVMKKLRDTYLEVLSARTKALTAELAPRARLPEGMAGEAPAGATPIRAALAGVMEGLDVPRETEVG